ncbi:MAG: bestrophin family protein [Cyclobacteriaceae bacterium]
MIYYKTNQNWLRDISHLFTSYTMKKVVVGSLLVGAYAFVLAMLHAQFEFLWHIQLGSGIFSLLGLVLSILLVFRTNTAYDRWWEGRKHWGALVNHCRNLAIAAQTTFPFEDKVSRSRMAILISNFCLAFKEHLREGTKIEELISLSPDEKLLYATKNHVPNFISGQIHQLVEQMHRENLITPYDHLNFKPHTQALLDILGACERIKKTPIPFSYNVYLKILISAYALILPFALIPEFGFWAVIMVIFVFFAFIGLELMAEEIEEPFGLDCNDLPTGDISNTISRNVFEILIPEIDQDTVNEKVTYEKIF